MSVIPFDSRKSTLETLPSVFQEEVDHAGLQVERNGFALQQLASIINRTFGKVVHYIMELKAQLGGQREEMKTLLTLHQAELQTQSETHRTSYQQLRKEFDTQEKRHQQELAALNADWNTRFATVDQKINGQSVELSTVKSRQKAADALTHAQSEAQFKREEAQKEAVSARFGAVDDQLSRLRQELQEANAQTAKVADRLDKLQKLTYAGIAHCGLGYNRDDRKIWDEFWEREIGPISWGAITWAPPGRDHGRGGYR